MKKQLGGPRMETRLNNVLLPNKQPRSQGNIYIIIDQPRFQSNTPSNRWYIARIFQIWSAAVGYKELAALFEPIRNSEIFWMNNKMYYPAMGSTGVRLISFFREKQLFICVPCSNVPLRLVTGHGVWPVFVIYKGKRGEYYPESALHHFFWIMYYIYVSLAG